MSDTVFPHMPVAAATMDGSLFIVCNDGRVFEYRPKDNAWWIERDPIPDTEADEIKRHYEEQYNAAHAEDDLPF